VNKYIKYYLSTALIISAIYFSSIGKNFPTYYFILFSLFIILGDLLLPKDSKKNNYSYPILINIPIYLNLPLLIIYLVEIIFVFGNYEPIWVIDYFDLYLSIDLIYMKYNITLLDKVLLMINGVLFIGMLGTVPGHELTHRKRNKFDMFFGNWLLSISWDCAFALEHVYGHHKHVGLVSDPATAKRQENIYLFMIKASIMEHVDAWKIEIKYLKRHGYFIYGIRNKMIIGYFRSLSISFLAFSVGGLRGAICYILCAIAAKLLLEAINYIEHYGLVREPGRPVCPRHSWNANDVISSLLLYNVTRHSAHHEKASLRFWELDSYPSAPTLPFGYLTMLYIVVLCPPLFHYLMKAKLEHWDTNFATPRELDILKLK